MRQVQRARGALAVAAWLVSTALVSAASAQEPGFRADRYQATPTTEDGLRVMLPDTLGHLRWSAAFTVDYALNPVVIARDTGQEATLLEHRVGGQLTAALGVLGMLQAHLRLPVVLSQSGEDGRVGRVPYEAPEGGALGDLALGASGEFFDIAGLSMGAAAELVLPTGNDEKLAGDVGLEPWGWLLAAYEVSIVRIGGQLGGGYRPDRELEGAPVGSELEGRLGVWVAATDELDISVEATAIRGLRGRDADAASDGGDAMLGARYALPFGLSIGAGVGAGFSDVLGNPNLRALLTIGAAAEKDDQPPAPKDEPEPEPEAPPPPPEPDTDGDGLPDGADGCLDKAEDKDGFEDDDGCPDLDNDGDFVPDAEDKCPDQKAETKDGCPAKDKDSDGVADDQDKCPDKAEDKDGFQDEDGCPDPDNDGDGVADSADECATAPGKAEDKGCPLSLRLEDRRIRLLKPLPMRPGRAALRVKAGPVLEEIAATIAANAHLGVLQIAVVPTKNKPKQQKLALKRAKAIAAALADRKVPGERMEAVAAPDKADPKAEPVMLYFGALPTAAAPKAADDKKQDPKPAAKKPAAKKPAAKKPAAKKPAAKKPAAKKPAAKKPEAKKAPAKKPAASTPPGKKTETKKPAAKKPATGAQSLGSPMAP